MSIADPDVAVIAIKAKRPDALPDPFTAIREELGLKLQSAKARSKRWS